MVFWRIRDGKIVERWATLDRLGLQQQLAPKS
jgi:predicted ester cyclase